MFPYPDVTTRTSDDTKPWPLSKLDIRRASEWHHFVALYLWQYKLIFMRQFVDGHWMNHWENGFYYNPALEIAHICVVTYIWLIMHMHGCALSCQCRKWWGTRITKSHGDVIKWIFFPRYWQIVRGIHRSPVNSPHKGQWRGALIFSLICVWINGWVNNREAGD